MSFHPTMATTIGGSEMAKSKLLALFVAMGLSLVIVGGTTIAVVELGIMARHPDWNTRKQFVELDDPYSDIARNTIPFVQQWYRGISNSEPLIPQSSFRVGTQIDTSCLTAYWAEIGERSTSPAFVELVLDHLGLRSSLQVRKLLSDYLDEPKSLSTMLNDSYSCLLETVGLPQLACTMRRNYLWNLTDSSQGNYLEYMVNLYAILEVLTDALPQDFPALHEVVDIMVHTRFAKVEDYIKQAYSGSEFEFRFDKVSGVFRSMELLGASIAANKLVQGSELELSFHLSMNILEAVKTGALRGHEANARLGLALASTIPFTSHVNDQEIRWMLGKPWIDAYITWNMAFIVEGLSYLALAKLSIPSVICASSDDKGENWIIKRAISLALSLMFILQEPATAVDLPADVLESIQTTFSLERKPNIVRQRFSVGDALGDTNRKTASITSPSRNAVETLLYNLCGQTLRRLMGSHRFCSIRPHE